MEKPGGCWAYLPVSDHNWWPLCNTLAQIFPKNDDSVANWPCHTLWHRHVCGILLNEVIFLTVNHCGPLPVRKLHSTGETIVWRDPGGSWACLRPVSDYERTCTFRGCRWHVQTYMSVLPTTSESVSSLVIGNGRKQAQDPPGSLHTIVSSVEWSSLKGRSPWWFTVRKTTCFTEMPHTYMSVSSTASGRVN